MNRACRHATSSLITEGLMSLINRLPDAFFTRSAQERRDEIERLTKVGPLRLLAQDWLSSGTYAGIVSGLYDFARQLGPCPLVIVQSASALNVDNRVDLQNLLEKRKPGSLIMFQVVPELCGGIRIFANGELMEDTWRGRLRTLMSRINEYTYA